MNIDQRAGGRALANRRLQPLGHVSARGEGLLVSIDPINTGTSELQLQTRTLPGSQCLTTLYCSFARYARLVGRTPGGIIKA